MKRNLTNHECVAYMGKREACAPQPSEQGERNE